MYYAYLIENTINQAYYVGITGNPVKRWSRHRANARNLSGKARYKTYLYSAMRKYGVENFTFEILKTFEHREDCENFEISTIQWFKDQYIKTYNLHKGGNLGFSMLGHKNYKEWKQKLSDNSIGNAKGTPAYDAWVEKLKKARRNRQPALGMVHTSANKELFKKVSREYWETQDTYIQYANDIIKLSHKEAKSKFGISTTHYYRLKKRFTGNDSE